MHGMSSLTTTKQHMPSVSSHCASIGVVLITHNAEKHLRHCLPPLLSSPSPLRVLVVNSSSQDNTVAIATEMGAETLVVPRAEFNHGLTRERARKHIGTDIVVMMTPDAYLVSPEEVQKLVVPLLKGDASVSYGRQIPHERADFFEAFHREYNYPNTSQIRSIEDMKAYGVYTFFCSDSFAAYSNAALDEIGGFQSVLLGEDTLAVSQLLHRGHKVAYVAEARVRHSHRYTLFQEFQRHFDTGLARRALAVWLSPAGSDAQRGKDYVFTLLDRLWKESPSLIPYACIQSLVRFMGYQLGFRGQSLPLIFKRRLSGQDFFWK